MTTFQDDIFKINIEAKEELNEIIYNWTKEICDYRLHEHFERKEKKAAGK